MKTHDYELVQERFEMNVNLFCYENKVYPISISKRSNTDFLNVLRITNEEKSHCVFIKNFVTLKYSKAKTKIVTKNTSVWHVYKILLLVALKARFWYSQDVNKNPI